MALVTFDSIFPPSLGIGESVRWKGCPFCDPDHYRECSKTTRTERGWKFYCHRCGKGKAKYSVGFTPAAAKAHLSTWQKRGELRTKSIFLPKDFNQNIPPQGYKWLIQYGITPALIAKYGIGFSEYYNRVVLPVYRGNDLAYWQGRNVGKATQDNPKYLNVSCDREDTYFELWQNADDPEGPIVLVEDILSAIRVHEAGFNAISLLGTNLTEHLLAKLMSKTSNGKCYVVIWLDPDMRKKMIGFIPRFTSLGIPTRVEVSAQEDPKDYKAHEIQERLKKFEKALDKSTDIGYNNSTKGGSETT